MDVKTKIMAYWDSRGEKYDQSPGHVMLPEVWKSVLSDVFKDRMRILDVGCGTGFMSMILSELGHDVVGLDISKGMVRVAIEKTKRKNVKIDFKLGDAENLPFRDNTFDAVVSRHLIWTLPNPKKAISEFARVSKDRVVVIDGVWSDNSMFTRFRRNFGRLLIGIYERRNPFKGYHYRKEINYHLPFYGGVKAEVIAGIFKSIGLNVKITDLTWIRDLMKKELPLIYKLAWGKREYFMVEGKKD